MHSPAGMAGRRGGSASTRKDHNQLHALYHSAKPSSAAYGSVNELTKVSGIPRKRVLSYLHSDPTYTKFKPRPKKFVRLKTQSRCINEIWSADLAFFEKLAKKNDGVRYLFVAVDTLSRFLRVQPMKSKTAQAAKTAFSKMINSRVKPQKLWVDRGTEFAGVFKKFCSSNNIQIYSTNSEVKSAFAERNIRSLKNLLYKHMEDNNTDRYISKVKQFVETINSRRNRMTGLAPKDVKKSDEAFLVSLTNSNPVKKPKYVLGDCVRVPDAITNHATAFRKGYHIQNSREIYRIIAIPTLNPPTYQIENTSTNQAIKGKFYESELVKYTGV